MCNAAAFPRVAARCSCRRASGIGHSASRAWQAVPGARAAPPHGEEIKGGIFPSSSSMRLRSTASSRRFAIDSAE